VSSCAEDEFLVLCYFLDSIDTIQGPGM
jgi:hypothetical protein